MNIRKRSSVVIGGAGVMAVVLAAVAFAAFTGTDSSNAGTAKAAKVAVDVQGGEFSTQSCPTMLPGDSCSGQFTATNTGNVDEVFTAKFTSVASKPGCFQTSVTLPEGIFPDPQRADTSKDYNPGQSGTGTITTTLLESAGNECQEATNKVTVIVDAAPSDTPRP